MFMALLSTNAGEILRMTHSAEGLDQNGILRLSIIVRGEVPEVPDHNTITLQPYTEDYIQIGPGVIYGQSQRMMIINGMPVPYAWNHTITYAGQNVRMPFLVQTLRATGIKVSYDPLLQTMTFQIGTLIEEGMLVIILFIKVYPRLQVGLWGTHVNSL